MSTRTEITNQEFATRVDCHHSMASRLLNGQRLPSVELMDRISKAFSIPMEDLIAARLKGSSAMGTLLRDKALPAP